MCGIAGFLRGGGLCEGDVETLQRMCDAIAHRGPDDFGYLVAHHDGVALGNRRLAILDLSPLGHQPMDSQDGRFGIVYNGEIYNFRDVRAELEATGCAFKSQSDTEVIVESLARIGVEGTLKRLNGMFAFAAWDRENRKLILARDRLGEKPLYYGSFGGTFLFGSELKAIRPQGDFNPSLSRQALAQFLRYGYVPGPLCIYSGLAKLPAGCWIEVVPGGAPSEPMPYWSARDALMAGLREPGPLSEHEESLEPLLMESVRMRMISDVPLGAFLSGGIDSSLVVALMQAQSSRPVRTFTIGFSDPRYDESENAAAVAKHLGTDHTAMILEPTDAMNVIPELSRTFDEPFADISGIPTVLVSRMARRDVTVTLSGDGGDELFAGYSRYAWGARTFDRAARIPAGIRKMAAGALGGVGPGVWDAGFKAMGGALPKKYRARNPGQKVQKVAEALRAEGVEQFYDSLISCWQDPGRAMSGDGTYAPLRWSSNGAAQSDYLTHAMGHDLVYWLPDDILVKLDRAAMSVSLEGRVPLLDHRVVELAYRIPIQEKLRDGRGKWPLRRLLYKYVPQELIDRPKMGFELPVGEWLKGPMREWAEELLSEATLRSVGLLDPDVVRRVWSRHMTGRQAQMLPLWSALTLQAWALDARPGVVL